MRPLLRPTDAFSEVGISVFGPSARAARMEGSKAFSKEFMSRHSIPTAKHKTFAASQYEDAVSYVKTCGFKTVLKADGLAAGKGVLIPETVDEATAGLHEIMVANVFGNAGELDANLDARKLVDRYRITFLSRKPSRD